MSDLRSWEELSLLEQYACQYWDMYKDAYGFRPRGVDTSNWTEEDFRKEFEVLANIIEENYIAEQAAQAEATVKFEQRVADLIVSGARDRETALRWIHDAEGSDGDDEYLCFLVGLPYGYFRKETV